MIMITRLWWKEARQVWPAWGLLAVFGLSTQIFMRCYWGDEVQPGGYAFFALLMTTMYLFLIAAAVFAGERENRTLGLLDAIPIERWRVWTAKASFALGSTFALGFVLWLGAFVFGRTSDEWWSTCATGVVWSLTALGWGLLFSALMSNALFAAVLAMTGLSVSLLALVDLSGGPTTLESASALLVVALLTTAGSALAFHLNGPPRWEPRSRARSSRPLDVPIEPEPIEIEIAPKRLGRVWTYSVPRLVWETLREARPALWVLIAVGVVAPLTLSLNAWQLEVNFFVWMSLSLTAILTGVSAFNGENRGRTHRFLLQHGARPGVVWMVKMLTWWLIAALIWWIASLPLGRPAGLPQSNMSWITYQSIIFWAASGLTIGFGAAALCGMVFRRGITAGLIAGMACILIFGPIAALFAAGAFYPGHLVYVALATLLITWAWSGDWLLDRPGLAKWARLGLYSASAVVALSSAHIANRAWWVPTLSPLQASRTFQFDRIAAPVAEEDNAASLYREAARTILSMPAPYTASEPNYWGAVQSAFNDDWNENAPAVDEWLHRVEPALELVRKGAQRPACQYDDVRQVTDFTTPSEPPPYTLEIAPRVSARVRLARGDLAGAWAEIETLLRIARQYSHGFRPFSYQRIEPIALGMAMRWAADPRQTAATLEAARSSWKKLPSLASPADQVRLAALVFQNTLAMPRDELADNLFFRTSPGKKRKIIDPLDRLNYDLQTTPWEIARARKVFDLLAAAVIVNRESQPFPGSTASQPRSPFQWPGLRIEEQGRSGFLFPEDLEFLSDTTRLTRHALWSWNDGSRDLDNETARRALSLIFRLRLWQVRHDGALPRSLPELPPDDAPSAPPVDVYSTRLFGYVPSQGQLLLPLGVYGDRLRLNLESDRKKLKPTDDCMLLYSIGPDGSNDEAVQNVDWFGKGDVVFPLKDHVKPPNEDE